ncbi:MAG: hypothetical protein NTY03_16855, partial [Candidatus Bathyarchaeota archaeon]|nr:hypothetical protein [Candidatus Bathyarchaeota archaeon]
MGTLVEVVPVKSAELSLQIVAAIPSVPSDGKPHPAFFVTIVDALGKPSPIPFPLNVTVSSSDERLLQIQKTTMIGAASYYAIVNATSSTLETKQVEVTASASGYQSSKVVTSVGPPSGYPSSLMVSILPDVLLPLASSEAEIVITVVDGYGNPTKARSDVTVSLSSSSLQIADVLDKVLVIPTNEVSGKTKVITTGSQGTCSITASTTNLKTGSATLNVMGPRAQKIYIWAADSQTSGDTGYLFVGIVDNNMNPVKVVSPVTVSLYSSNSSKFYVPESITVGVGEWGASTTFTCLNLGSGTITASAKDLTSATVTMFGYSSTKSAYSLRVYPVTNSYLADERNYPYALLVQTVDQNGVPTTLHNDLYVDVFSSDSSILSVESPIWIPSGDSQALVSGIPKLLGNVRITVAASNLVTGEASVVCYAPVPDSIRVQCPPIPSGGEVDACLLVTSGGIPTSVLQDVTIKISSSNTVVGDSNVTSILLPKKIFSVPFGIKGTSPGSFSLTVQGSDLPTGNVQLTVLEARPKTFALSYVKPVVNYNFPIVIQLLSLQQSSALTYEPLKINVASSNTTNINLPSVLTIAPDSTEVLLYGKGLSTSMTTLTLSSPGYNSITAQMAPAPAFMSMQILPPYAYPFGKIATIKMSVTLDGAPVKGVPVVWKGRGLVNNNTITNDQGIAENEFMVSEGQNRVEVAINTGGSNYLSVSRIIQGVLGQYNLVIESNSPVMIIGSGTYTYGQSISLNAPTVVPMSGILGVLGGKYIFSKWSGAVESSNNEEILQITGLQPTITVRAEYVQDFMMVIVAGLVIGAACIGGGFIYYKKFRRMKPGPDEDSESVVDGAETDAITTTTQEQAPTQDQKPKEGASETPHAPEVPKLTAAQIKAEIVRSKGISNYDPTRSANVIKKIPSEDKSVPTPQTELKPLQD